MAYNGSICGVTTERFTCKIPVSVGCPYNKCTFCGFYKHLEYRELPLEDIEAELARIRDAGGKPDRIMLGDGNPLWMPFDRLKQIVEMIEHYLPSCTSIASDATILAIEGKTDEELAWLADHGYRMLYVGIESGLDDVLEFIHKDHDNTQAREQIARLHKAGIDFSAHIMTGVAGAGRGIENARATAALVNELRPVHICNFSIYVGPITELGLYEEDGLFKQASSLENLIEMRELVSLLDVPETELFFEGYFSTYLPKPEGKGAGTTSKVLVNEAGEFVRKSRIARGDLRVKRDEILSELDSHIESTTRYLEGCKSVAEHSVA